MTELLKKKKKDPGSLHCNTFLASLRDFRLSWITTDITEVILAAAADVIPVSLE